MTRREQRLLLCFTYPHDSRKTHKIRSLPDANHAIVEWTETEGILPRLWSLYEKGPRTIDDRNTLRAPVVAITSASDQQAEVWIRAEENLQGHSSETMRTRNKLYILSVQHFAYSTNDSDTCMHEIDSLAH